MNKISLRLEKYNFAISRFYEEIADDAHMRDKVLSMFPPKRVLHSGNARQVSEPAILDSSMKLNIGKATTDFTTFLQSDVTKFKEFLCDLIYEIQEEMKKQTLEEIDKTAKATGNEIIEKENLWDMYIEGIEKVDMRFDKYGNPIFWLFPLNFPDKLSKVKPTLEQSQKVEEVFKRRRKQYFSQKRSRKLLLG